jgi:hypothetical protein
METPPPILGEERKGETVTHSDDVFARFPPPYSPPVWGRGICDAGIVRAYHPFSSSGLRRKMRPKPATNRPSK